MATRYRKLAWLTAKTREEAAEVIGAVFPKPPKPPAPRKPCRANRREHYLSADQVAFIDRLRIAGNYKSQSSALRGLLDYLRGAHRPTKD